MVGPSCVHAEGRGAILSLEVAVVITTRPNGRHVPYVMRRIALQTITGGAAGDEGAICHERQVLGGRPLQPL